MGLSENQIAGGQADPAAALAEARWNIRAGEGGNVYIRNEKTGTYLQVAGTLSAEPATVYPYYAKEDNGRHAFYIQVSADNVRCFNVGQPDADGKGGPLSFANPADRTRLRWVIEQLDVTTGISELTGGRENSRVVATEYYSLQGTRLAARPAAGLYIEKARRADGTVNTVKRTAAR